MKKLSTIDKVNNKKLGNSNNKNVMNSIYFVDQSKKVIKGQISKKSNVPLTTHQSNNIGNSSISLQKLKNKNVIKKSYSYSTR